MIRRRQEQHRYWGEEDDHRAASTMMMNSPPTTTTRRRSRNNNNDDRNMYNSNNVGVVVQHSNIEDLNRPQIQPYQQQQQRQKTPAISSSSSSSSNAGGVAPNSIPTSGRGEGISCYPTGGRVWAHPSTKQQQLQQRPPISPYNNRQRQHRRPLVLDASLSPRYSNNSTASNNNNNSYSHGQNDDRRPSQPLHHHTALPQQSIVAPSSQQQHQRRRPLLPPRFVVEPPQHTTDTTLFSPLSPESPHYYHQPPTATTKHGSMNAALNTASPPYGTDLYTLWSSSSSSHRGPLAQPTLFTSRNVVHSGYLHSRWSDPSHPPSTKSGGDNRCRDDDNTDETDDPPSLFAIVRSSSPTVVLYGYHPNDTTGQEPRHGWDLDHATKIELVGDDDKNDDDDDDDDNSEELCCHTTKVGDDNADRSLVNSGTETQKSRIKQQQQPQHRIAITWDNTDNNNDRGVVLYLDAPSQEEAEQWKQVLQKESKSYLQTQLAQEQDTCQALRQQIQQMERTISEYRCIEQDRDGAIADARKYQSDFHQLDEAIRQLVIQQLRPQSSSTTPSTSSSSTTDEPSQSGENADVANAKRNDDLDKPLTDSVNADKQGDTLAVSKSDNILTSLINPPKIKSIDNLVAGQAEPFTEEKKEDDDNVENVDATVTNIDWQQVPGVHFSALYNAVDQLRENWKLATIEATTAVTDVTTAQERIRTLEQRMVQAEVHLCQIWEENCALRKSLKQKKREKRVLVREIRTARSTTAATTATHEETTAVTVAHRHRRLSNNDDNNIDPASALDKKLSNFTDEFLQTSDEEKLIQELEGHVMSSIRLHEAFLAANEDIQLSVDHDAAAAATTTTMNSPHSGRRDEISLDFSGTIDDGNNDELDSESQPRIESSPDAVAHQNVKLRKAGRHYQQPTIHPNVPLFEGLPVASLMDEYEEEDSDDASGSQEQLTTTNATVASNNHQVQLHLSDEMDEELDERPNPLLQLLHDDDNGGHPPRLCAASSQSESSSRSSIVAVKATSTLSCPLADVVSMGTPPTTTSEDDFHVYHLTFYSRKIGIQFQKVPAPPVKVKGLLTEAMTDELADGIKQNGGSSSSAEGNTAAELRRIAAITSKAKASSSNSNINGPDMCEVATPVHAVLVCGFDGFDDTGSNVRPKLGARLVAFDGVSVEVGRWTFDAIRKSIQARSRPLTLSFRNDFLTTEQRRILTKAVQDVDAATTVPRPRPPPASVIHNDDKDENHPVDNAPTPENNTVYRTLTRETTDDDLTQSGTESDHQHHHFPYSFPQSFSGSRSVSSAYQHQYRSFGGSDAHSVASSSAGNFRSFSEAGSTASVLSAVAPLVSNLLNLRQRQQSHTTTRGPFTPEYLRRAPESVEGTPQHQDFQADLL